MTVNTLLVLDTFHSSTFVFSLRLDRLFRQITQSDLSRMVVPVCFELFFFLS